MIRARLRLTATPMMMAPGAANFTVTIEYDVSESEGRNASSVS